MRHTNRTSNKGVALVLVLCLLVLISGVVIAFFSSVSTEYISAKSASAGASGKELADATVQLVMSQIRQATSKGPNIAWASQPGMIRTFGEAGGSASSRPLAYYKLYSSDKMIVDGVSINVFKPEDDVPASWHSSPSIYTDLNAPLASITGTGAKRTSYPIMDPAAAEIVSGTNSMVEGFAIDTTGTSPANSINSPANTAPMPARWIYVLRDGSMVAPSAAVSTGTAARFSGTKAPTAANPIVGRIAFWTDDETCKLNINTSVGGAPWDQPMFNSGLEAAFSRYQPSAHDFARYPGHPSGTTLSPVLWSFSSMPSPDHGLAPNLTPSPSISSREDWAPKLPDYALDYWQKALRLSPRNELGDTSSAGNPGGSVMGTNATAGAGLPFGVGKACPVDADRLFTSVDELMFNPARSGRAVQNTYEFQLDKAGLQKVRFFLTATSRAPEVNLYNQPKVAIWPVPDLANKSVANKSSVTGDTRSPSDKLIAFCSTLNEKPYYFTRYDATNPSNDFSARNLLIYNYLNALLAKPVPGFGGTFSTRYGQAGSSQILTEIYDYIRSCVNLQDSSSGKESDPMVARMKWAYATLPTPRTDNNQVGSDAAGVGQVTPFIHPSNGTKGLGHFPTIKQATIMFIARGANQPPLQVITSGSCVGRPILFDKDDNSLLDGDNQLTAYGAEVVITGSALARANDMHPYSADANISQMVFTDSNGVKGPVLAVNEDKLETNPNDKTAIYPIFNTNNAYPTLCRSVIEGKDADTSVKTAATGGVQTITVNGVSYKYFKARNIDIKNNTIVDKQLPVKWNFQTHSGLQYLTVPRLAGASVASNMEGAYDLPNPRYQIVANGQQTLAPYQTTVEAVFFVDPVNNAPGFASLCSDYQVRIRGLEAFRADSNNLQFTADATEVATYLASNGPMGGSSLYDLGAVTHLGLRTNYPEVDGTVPARKQNYYSQPTVVGGDPSTQGGIFTFGGNSSLTVDLLTSGSNVVQTYHIEFPGGTFPTPKLPFIPRFAALNESTPDTRTFGVSSSILSYSQEDLITAIPLNYPPKNIADLTPSTVLTFFKKTISGAKNPLAFNPNYGVGCPSLSGTGLDSVYGVGFRRNKTDITKSITHGLTRLYSGSYNGPGMELILPERDVDPGTSDYKYKLSADTVRSVECLYGDTRVIAALKDIPTAFFQPHKYYNDLTMRSAHSLHAAAQTGIFTDGGRGSTTAHRGATLSYLTDAPVKLSDNKTSYITSTSATAGAWGSPVGAPDKIRELLGASTRQFSPLITYGFPHVTSSVDFTNAAFREIWSRGGDFDNGPNFNPDGPYINKPPETSARDNSQNIVPDFNCSINENRAAESMFSPNRQISSPVMFGSLPAGFQSGFDPTHPRLGDIDPWRTLLFCPNPNSKTHPSLDELTPPGSALISGKAPDFTLLDLFHMPIVEPYAISEPFSTAGKVNMNYQIAPYTFIKRDTALRGVLRSVLVNAVDDKFIAYYKGTCGWFVFKGDTAIANLRKERAYWDFRYPIHLGATLQQFEERFKAGDMFRSASEICSLWLYPAMQPDATHPDNPKKVVESTGYDPASIVADNITNLKGWWYDNPGDTRKSLTGDNMRERPYAALYPRLTTKSNSYTVHFRVQVLKKKTGNGSNPDEWVESRDHVLSEYRGSSLVERYIDPNDPNLPDFANSSNTETLDDYYKFRIVNTKKFTAE